MESDCGRAIQTLQEHGVRHSISLVHHIWDFLDRQWEVHLLVINRESNMVADALANLAWTLSFGFHDFVHPPTIVSRLVMADLPDYLLVILWGTQDKNKKMSFPCSSLPASTLRSFSNENRRSANFHPSIWGDIFLSRPSKMNIDTETRQEYEEQKQEIKRMLMVPTEDPSHKLHLIATIKRLGVSYHFEKEIEDTLHHHHYNSDQSLQDTSLRFRLLRENGFNVRSAEIFNKFKDDKGKFNMSLTRDVKGLLELYEASHLNVHGEHILEEALAFTTTHLKFAEGNGIRYPLSARVSHALNRPIRKSLPRLEARHFISLYQEDHSHEKTLLKFAKLDFNLLQNLHKEELSKISRWWKDLDFESKLPFTRNRLVEGYFWILGVYFEPEYSFAREILTKVIAMASTMDDIYDVHGTFEEFQLFTDEMERFAIYRLPTYMQFFYKALLDLYEEMEEVMIEQGKSYRVQYAKEAMKQLSQAYFVEAKWYNENYVPTIEEYMKNCISIIWLYHGYNHIFCWNARHCYRRNIQLGI
ncbi:hypothetical protein GQ457_01G005480 [Hibiscus cannabinus]